MTTIDRELPGGGTEDLEVAQLAIRVHCSISWPDGNRCLNCHELHPCASFRWGAAALVAAGWSDGQIQALDLRTGAWS
jgi:hypothetical protein